MTERRVLRYGFLLTVLAILWLCGACAMPDQLLVRGMITTVREDPRYEPPCHFGTPNLCQLLAYQAYIVDSTGHRQLFYFFVDPTLKCFDHLTRADGTARPTVRPCVIPWEGMQATLTLHRRALCRMDTYAYTRATTSAYCPTDLAMALDDEGDITP